MSKRKRRKKPAVSTLERGLLSVGLFLGLAVLGLMVYIGYRIGVSSRQLIPIGVVALVGGVLFEGRRLFGKWSTVLWTALGALLMSLVGFLPYKREYEYDFERHIEAFPYAFLLFFAILAIAFLGDKAIPKLTEGITFLQSIAVIYWVVDYGFVATDSVLLRTVMVTGLLFSLYAAFHAFTRTALSRSSRLTLSIWSTVITLLLAVDNIYRVYQHGQVENAGDIGHGLYIALQYFLLGVSSIYIVRHVFMLAGFLPPKGGSSTAQYRRQIKEMKRDHIRRFSDRQVKLSHAVFCLGFAGTIFALNYSWQLVPRNVAIWTVFVVFPLTLRLYDRATRSEADG